MAKKNSSEPKTSKVKKRRWYHQVKDIYVDVQRQESNTIWIILAIVFGGIGLGVAIGFLNGHPIITGVGGLLLSLPVIMLFLGRRAERLAYARIEGQPGAVSAALGTIRRGWSIESDPVGIDPRIQDMVFRIVGRPGVVLISEGPPQRAVRLLSTVTRKVQRVIPIVPVV